MRPSVVIAASLAAVCLLATAPASADPMPGVSTDYTVDSTSAVGTSFTYDGTLSSTDLLTIKAQGSSTDGLPCLQPPIGQSSPPGAAYCTNAAGVVVTLGVGAPVGGSSPDGATTFGALLLTINGVTEQVFMTDAANGLCACSTPLTILMLTQIPLSELGFGPFSLVDPTLTFTIDDTIRSDDFGGFEGAFTLEPASVSAVPEPASIALLGLGIAGMALVRRRRRG